MKNFRLAMIVLVLSMLACQAGQPPAPAASPAASQATVEPQAPNNTQPPPTAEAAAAQATASPTSAPAPAASGEPLPVFQVDLTRPFGLTASPVGWTPADYGGQEGNLPVDLESIHNPQVLANLTDAQRDFLAQNGFVVIHSQEAQFADIRTLVSEVYGQPYFLTTDAAYHALHLHFDETLKAIERQWLRPEMVALTGAVLDDLLASREQLAGTPLEAENEDAIAYLSVALRLFDPQAQVDPGVEARVADQVAQIMAGAGRDRSVIFPDFEDDYGAYKPVGHYAGDTELEAYFRGMTWFGRVHFALADAQNPDFKPSRVPLVITLAMRRAVLNDAPASDAWGQIHEVLNFIVGPSDDNGPLEYAALMDRIYGETAVIATLADDGLWKTFQDASADLPAPQINSTFASFSADLDVEKGWRFMGQRFTLDGLVFQNLVFDKIEARPTGERRLFPSGLDVMATFGSETARAALDQYGDINYPNYADQMDSLRRVVQEQDEAQWVGRFYDGWLYSFFPLLETKDGAYPGFMRSPAWGYKDLNTALGSWAELKHDTILYSKMPEAMGGGGPPSSGPAPAYVEPNPLAFRRLAYIASSLAEGIALRAPDLSDVGPNRQIPLGNYLEWMQRLADRFEVLGEIAARELAGDALTMDDYYSVVACLGMIECLSEVTPYNVPEMKMPPAAVVAAVTGAGNQVLEVGVGNIDRIYVLAPLEGKLQAAQGGVLSYYEFLQPRSDRLTDEQWQARLASAQPPALPAWAENFVLDGGAPAEWLAFRVGDVYLINEAGDELNVRASPSRTAAVLGQFRTNDYVEIVDGPVTAGGFTWWKLKCSMCFASGDEALTGWSVEQPEWYERAYGQ